MRLCDNLNINLTVFQSEIQGEFLWLSSSIRHCHYYSVAVSAESLTLYHQWKGTSCTSPSNEHLTDDGLSGKEQWNSSRWGTLRDMQSTSESTRKMQMTYVNRHGRMAVCIEYCLYIHRYTAHFLQTLTQLQSKCMLILLEVRRKQKSQKSWCGVYILL